MDNEVKAISEFTDSLKKDMERMRSGASSEAFSLQDELLWSMMPLSVILNRFFTTKEQVI